MKVKLDELTYEQQKKIVKSVDFIYRGESYTYDELKEIMEDNPLALVEITADQNISIKAPLGFVEMCPKCNIVPINYYVIKEQVQSSNDEPSYKALDDEELAVSDKEMYYSEFLGKDNIYPIHDQAHHDALVEMFIANLESKNEEESPVPAGEPGDGFKDVETAVDFFKNEIAKSHQTGSVDASEFVDKNDN